MGVCCSRAYLIRRYMSYCCSVPYIHQLTTEEQQQWKTSGCCTCQHVKTHTYVCILLYRLPPSSHNDPMPPGLEPSNHRGYRKALALLAFGSHSSDANDRFSAINFSTPVRVLLYLVYQKSNIKLSDGSLDQIFPKTPCSVLETFTFPFWKKQANKKKNDRAPLRTQRYLRYFWHNLPPGGPTKHPDPTPNKIERRPHPAKVIFA